jgi:hypothetical protein
MNYPPDVSPTDPTAPWNKERSQYDIEQEIGQLLDVGIVAYKLYLKLKLLPSTDELFSSAALASYDANNPVDMLEAMLDIISTQLASLKQQ